MLNNMIILVLLTKVINLVYLFVRLIEDLLGEQTNKPKLALLGLS